MRQIVVGKNDAGQSIVKFMGKRFKSMPTSLIHKYLRKKCVTIDKKKISEDYILQDGDVLTFYISDEFFGVTPKDEPYLTIEPNLSIVYEDENILLVDKPAGLLVHSDETESYHTLINYVLAYLYRKGEYQPEKENCFAPALCNRIDRNTQGIVIAAKNAAALAEMNEIIKQRKAKKTYLAAIHGIPEETSGEFRSKIEKNQKSNIVKVNQKYGKEAITRYHVLKTNYEKNLSLVEVELLTGRTHQIRAQFADAGHPLLGDGKYAVNKEDRKQGFTYQALCSYSLQFILDNAFPTLKYLNGRKFTAEKPSFLKLFH